MIFVNFFKRLVLTVLIFWLCNVHYEASLFLAVDPHDAWPIVKQMLVSLDGEVPKGLGVIIPDYFFWFYSPVFTVLMVVLSTYDPVCY